MYGIITLFLSLMAIIIAIIAQVLDKNNLPGILSLFVRIKTM